MRIEDCSINPLPKLLEIIPAEGIHLNRDILINLGNIFKVGGVVAENYHEVIKIIQLIEEWYGIWRIEHKEAKYYLIRTKYGN